MTVYPPEPDVTAGGYYALSIPLRDTASGHELAQAEGYPAPQKVRLENGGGGMLAVGRFLLEGGGGGGGARNTANDRETVLGRGYGRFQAGYILLQRNGLRIYPLLGLGGGGGGLVLRRSRGRSRPDAVLGSGGPTFTIGLGVDLLFPFARRTLLFGFRFGYTFMYSRGQLIKGGKTTPYASPGQSGPFFSVTVGGQEKIG